MQLEDLKVLSVILFEDNESKTVNSSASPLPPHASDSGRNQRLPTDWDMPLACAAFSLDNPVRCAAHPFGRPIVHLVGGGVATTD